jgi:hypothetical protein
MKLATLRRAVTLLQNVTRRDLEDELVLTIKELEEEIAKRLKEKK